MLPPRQVTEKKRMLASKMHFASHQSIGLSFGSREEESTAALVVHLRAVVLLVHLES